MQIKALLLGLALSSGAAVQVRVPGAAAPTAVPVPAAPTATLPPVPEKLSCKKLDTCLAENGGDDTALKTCVMRDLGEEKGNKVWGILSKARLADKKPSLALLKTSAPKAYTAVLQALFSQTSKVLLVADLCAVDEPKIPKHLRSPEHVKVPTKTAVTLPQPPNGHPGTALAKSAPATKAMVEPVKVPNAPKVALPTPHGHPEAAVAKKDTKHEEPATCKKLDACLEQVDHAHYLAGYENCITGFCQELHGEKEFTKSDDPRTTLCDKAGLDAMDILAKAAAEAKALKLPELSDAEAQKMAPKLALMETKPSLMAFSVVQTLFSKSSTAIELEHACTVRPKH